MVGKRLQLRLLSCLRLLGASLASAPATARHLLTFSSSSSFSLGQVGGKRQKTGYVVHNSKLFPNLCKGTLDSMGLTWVYYSMVFYGLLWSSMVFYGFDYGLLWSTMVYYGLLWSTMVYYGPLWSTGMSEEFCCFVRLLAAHLPRES